MEHSTTNTNLQLVQIEDFEYTCNINDIGSTLFRLVLRLFILPQKLSQRVKFKQ